MLQAAAVASSTQSTLTGLCVLLFPKGMVVARSMQNKGEVAIPLYVSSQFVQPFPHTQTTIPDQEPGQPRRNVPHHSEEWGLKDSHLVPAVEDVQTSAGAAPAASDRLQVSYNSSKLSCRT